MTDEQFQQIDTQLGGLNGALNVLAEAVSPVDSSVHQAITEMSANLAKWQAAQTEVIKNGFAMVADALARGDSEKLDAIIEMLRSLGGVPAQQDLHTAKLDLIHGLITVDIQEKIDKLTADLKPEADALEGSAQEGKQ